MASPIPYKLIKGFSEYIDEQEVYDYIHSASLELRMIESFLRSVEAGIKEKMTNSQDQTAALIKIQKFQRRIDLKNSILDVLLEFLQIAGRLY